MSIVGTVLPWHARGSTGGVVIDFIGLADRNLPAGLLVLLASIGVLAITLSGRFSLPLPGLSWRYSTVMLWLSWHSVLLPFVMALVHTVGLTGSVYVSLRLGLMLCFMGGVIQLIGGYVYTKEVFGVSAYTVPSGEPKDQNRLF